MLNKPQKQTENYCDVIKYSDMTPYMLSSVLIHCKHVIMINYHESKCRNDLYIIQIVFSDLRSNTHENNENNVSSY